MSRTQDVEARVRRFVPKGLSQAEWAVAREVVTAAVVAAEPPTLEQAKLLASRLCAFLAWLPVDDWDRTDGPALELVLNEGRVLAFTSAEGMPHASKRSRDAYRVNLNRLVRALAGVVRVGAVRHDGAPVAARAFWPRVADAGPFPVLAAAYSGSGSALHGGLWAGIVDDLTLDLTVLPARGDRAVAANAPAEPAGTVRRVQAAAASLRDAKTPVTEVVPANAPGSSFPAPREAVARSGKRPSPAAAKRAARAAQAARTACELVTPAASDLVMPPATPPALPDELAAMLVDWTPQDLDSERWPLVREAVTAAVVAYRPTSARTLRNCRSIIVAFASWVQAREGRGVDGDLRVEEFCGDGLVDAYLAGPLEESPAGSRATTRSVLRRVGRNLDPRPAPEKIAYQPVQPPYSVAECAAFVLMARNQPTDPLRRSLSAMVALGLGAGLGAEDQRVIAPCHIREVDLGEWGTALAVDVPGSRARSVIVRDQYEDLLREALALHAKARRGKSTPLCGVKPNRKNGANRVAAKAVTATGTGIEINAARLRATWLVACMSAAVPLGALLHASGLRTPRTLNDLLPYCPTPDPEAVAAVLRSVAGTPDDPTERAVAS